MWSGCTWVSTMLNGRPADDAELGRAPEFGGDPAAEPRTAPALSDPAAVTIGVICGLTIAVPEAGSQHF